MFISVPAYCTFNRRGFKYHILISETGKSQYPSLEKPGYLKTAKENRDTQKVRCRCTHRIQTWRHQVEEDLTFGVTKKHLSFGQYCR